MRQLLNLAWGALLITALALPSCATHKQLTTPPAPESQPTSGGRIEQPLDSMTFAQHPTLLDKLLGRTPTPVVVPVDVARRPISLGRKSTANFYYGPATVTTNTVGKNGALASGSGASVKGDTKAKGGSVVSQDSSVSNALTGGGNLAGANGAGSHVTQVVPPPVPKLTAWQKLTAGLGNVWSAVKWPLAVVVGVFGVGTAICALAPASGVGVWLLALVKRRTTKTTTV